MDEQSGETKEEEVMGMCIVARAARRHVSCSLSHEKRSFYRSD